MVGGEPVSASPPEPAEFLPAHAAAARRAEGEDRHRRGTRQLLLARALFMVCGYLASVVLARELGPAAFGVYGVLLATLVWLEIVSYAGVPGAVGRLMPLHRDDSAAVERSARFVLFGTSLTLFAIGWVLAPVVERLFQVPDGARLFRLAILDIPVAAAFAGYGGVLMGRRQFGTLGVSQALFGAAKLASVLVLLLVGISVAHALVANVLATCTALLYLLVRFPPRGFRPVWHLVRRIVALGLPMGGFVISLQVLISLDVWFLGSVWHGSRIALGQYVAALKIAQSLIVVPVVQSGVVLSSVAWALASGDRVGARRHVLEASRFALVITVAACAIVGGNASSLMNLLYSSAYAAGGPFLILQLIAFSCFALMDVYAHALMAAGRQRATAAVLVSFIPIVAAANYFLVPQLGPMGAAISLVVGMLGVAAVIGALVWRQFGPPLETRTLGRVAAAGALVAVPAVAVRTSGLLVLVEVVVLAAAYLFVLALVGAIGREDLGLPRAAGRALPASPGAPSESAGG